MYPNTIYGRYYPIQSKIHEMNASAKVLCVLLFLITIIICPSMLLQSLLLLLTLLMLLMTNIPLVVYFKTTIFLIPIYFLLFLLGIFFPISVIMIAIKMTLGLFHIIMLSFTTSLTEMIYGLEHIIPILRIKKNGLSLAYMVAGVFKIIPNLIDEKNRILKYTLCKKRHQTPRDLFSSLKFILRSTIKRKRSFDLIMKVRLYNHHRTNFRLNCWKIFDSYIVMIYIFILLFMIKKGIMG